MKTRSIAGLMVVVASVGLGVAALSRPSRLWGAVLFSSATAILLGAVLAAVLGKGRRRAFWAGFAIFGWGYLALQYGPWFETQVGPYTLPTALLDVLYPVVAPTPPNGVTTGATFVTFFQPQPVTAMLQGSIAAVPAMPGGSGGPGSPVSISGPGTPATISWATVPGQNAWAAWTELDVRQPWQGTLTPASFYRIGHSLLSLLTAVIGGLIALRIAQRDRSRPAEASVEL